MATTSSFARLVARPVDRVHIAASTVPSLEALLAIDGYAVSPGDAAFVASFLSREPMSWDELRVPLRYPPEERLRARLDIGVDAGVITFDDNMISYTPAGAEAARAVLDARATALASLWANTERQVGELLELVTPVADAATSAGKPSSNIVDRALTAPNAMPGSELWRALAKVRRFRADCHAQAWAAAGHSVESIVAVPADATDRLPIERHTDDLNAEIWTHLAQSNQLQFMALLASLDGAGTPN